MDLTNEELATSFDDAAAAAEKSASALEAAVAAGYTILDLDEPVADLVASQREYARLMRKNAQAARDLRS